LVADPALLVEVVVVVVVAAAVELVAECTAA
jgi:hypothetical protein